MPFFVCFAFFADPINCFRWGTRDSADAGEMPGCCGGHSQEGPLIQCTTSDEWAGGSKYEVAGGVLSIELHARGLSKSSTLTQHARKIPKRTRLTGSLAGGGGTHGKESCTITLSDPPIPPTTLSFLRVIQPEQGLIKWRY